MKTILIESLLVTASVLLWAIVLPLAALLSPVLLPLLAWEVRCSPVLPSEDGRPPHQPFLCPSSAKLRHRFD